MEVAHRRLLERLRTVANFDAAELDAFAGVLQVRRLPADGIVFRQGDPADGCYLIAEGRVRVTMTGGKEPLATLGVGDFVGQMAVLDGGRRSATCTAIEPTTVLYLGRDELDLLVRGRSSFALKFLDALTRMLVAQLRFANRRLLALAQQDAPADSDALRALAQHTFGVSLTGLDDIELVVPDGLKR
jgi:CRP/FNR family cyclic AMP-dependent transcriptional regulator